MQAALERLGDGLVDHAMTLDAALAGKSRGHDIEPEVGFAAVSPAGMAFVPVRFVLDKKVGGSEAVVQALCDQFLHHRPAILFSPQLAAMKSADFTGSARVFIIT
jgi:hypothetical protein